MNKYELMVEAIQIYQELYNNKVKLSNAKNMILCRKLHLIEEQLGEPLTYQICRDYLNNCSGLKSVSNK